MKFRYIRLIFVLVLSLSSCSLVPPPPATSTPIPTIVPSETPKPPDTPVPSNSPVPTPVLSIKVTNPISAMKCDNSEENEPFCLFKVQGTIAGLASFSEYRVYVFVFPEDPHGDGWYLQKTPASINSNGTWSQSPAYLGSATYPTSNGNTLKIRAVLVRANATINGTPLADFANVKEEIILQAVEDIDGDVAISDTVSLTLSK